MPKITYIDHNGKAYVVEVTAGQSVMEAAVKHAVPGIDADCGGACACATCHVYIDPEWTQKTGACTGTEREMLNFASEVADTSRLSCQLKIEPDWDGLVVRLPASQH